MIIRKDKYYEITNKKFTAYKLSAAVESFSDQKFYSK